MLHAPITFEPITELTRTTASSVKEHWRKVMQEVREQRMVVVTNHNEPQAVIISADQYRALQAKVEALEQSLGELRNQSPALTELRKGFDERLAVLQQAQAGPRARDLLRRPAHLGGKVKAGSGF
ncbi:type II toxin-antitoxin system Phd/YefM family antitoxin [Stenotrophomonas sp. Sa5BUN4]|uniref:Antitoxin n=1 Tax=Stenotrophomonas lacuserhaii TaxID=2760084 RepID=A0A8X8FTW8_9GAMM|nr:type II toxin-antitoxin system prevent-host-death family antitoxin [Stenotrophomonas pennii]MBD7955172.1 type II toxin-antitoxin system Phd/YefM family antitoxin [Stenotrophomonas pennii]